MPQNRLLRMRQVSKHQIFRQRKYTELKAAKHLQGMGTEKHLKLIFKVFCLGSERFTGRLAPAGEEKIRNNLLGTKNTLIS